MTSVKLTIPERFSSPFVLNALDISVEPLTDGTQPVLPAAVSFEANDGPPLHRTKMSFVARGWLRTSDRLMLDTACKIVRGPKSRGRLKNEAETYMNELYHLQGRVVPKFYGIFSGIHGDFVISCIFLEYCGVNPTEESLLPNRLLWYVNPIPWFTAQLTSARQVLIFARP